MIVHVLRKPLIGTVAANALQHGCGALNIDGCRVGSAEDVPSVVATRKSDYPQTYEGTGPGWGRTRGGKAGDQVNWQPKGGRWPANLVHDGSEEVLSLFPETSSGKMNQEVKGGFSIFGKRHPRCFETIGDSGSAARFFQQVEIK